jgi:hypothetical protein
MVYFAIHSSRTQELMNELPVVTFNTIDGLEISELTISKETCHSYCRFEKLMLTVAGIV